VIAPLSTLLGRRLAPFVAAAALGLVLGVVPGLAVNVREIVTAVALSVVVLLAVVLVPWNRVPAWVQPLPALTYLLVVALLRDAAGGAASGFGPLLLLPLFWLALYGTRAQLVAVLAGMAAVFYLPMLTLGEPAYPASGWRTGALFVVVSAIIGYTVQSLVARLRTVLSERAELLRRLETLAATDPLTGLGNRREWDAALERALATRRPLSIAVLDLDHFKRVNDTQGHQHGDRVLRAAAEAWSTQLRPGDVLARMGGEEFCVLLPDCALDGAVSVIERVRAATPLGQTCSAGVVEWDGEENAAALARRADLLLYQAKQAGRDRTAAAPAPRLLGALASAG
jgi:diguanylate cyclase (GGDEF)-like protein